MARSCMQVLSKDEIEQVHQTSLKILSEVGVKVDSPSVRDVLEKGGARVDKKRGIIYLDEGLVTGALKSAPKKVRICSRGGRDYTIPEQGVQLISPDGQPPAVFDVSKGQKRRSVLRDCIDFAIVLEALSISARCSLMCALPSRPSGTTRAKLRRWLFFLVRVCRWYT